MINILGKICIPLMVYCLLCSFNCFAKETLNADERYRELFSIVWENDYWVNDDDGYTNGIGLGYAKGLFKHFEEENTPGYMRWLAQPLPMYEDLKYERAISYALVQVMQTPQNIETKELQEHDLPYVGPLMFITRLHVFNEKRAEKAELTLGVVGPLSAAEQLQKVVHKITSSEKPRGWHNQLKNEPIFNFNYEKRWRATQGNLGSLEWDLVPLVAADLGNFQSGLLTSLNLRFGTNLVNTFPTASILSAREPDPLAGFNPGAWYFEVGAAVNYVFNDIMVEGNTWKDSHGLTIKHMRYMYGVGLSYSFGDCSLIWNLILASEIAKEVEDWESFGSLSFTMKL